MKNTLFSGFLAMHRQNQVFRLREFQVMLPVCYKLNNNVETPFLLNFLTRVGWKTHITP